MDGDADAGAGAGASTSDENTTPRKSLWRSVSWTARSSPTSNPNPNQKPKPNPVRPPRRPGRLALPLRPSLAGWPRPASDDTGPTPSASLADPDSADLSRVTDHVYLGSDSAARDRAALRRHGITHVLNCVGSACPDYFRGDGELVYKTLWLHDSPGEDLASVLYDAFDFLESAAAAPPDGGRALVHCVRGASRSAAVVVAYLMWRHALPFDSALRRVRTARPVADPNLGFAAQLLRRQPRSAGLPASPGSVRRILRLAPHSPYAPLHLVPKLVPPVDGPADSFLDSRGAFLVHVPEAIYIWIGAHCEPAMITAAMRAARQVVRYERAVGPIVRVDEGSEPDDFWGSLSDDPVILDSPQASKRRVDLYNLDFEIFQHALKSNATDELPESTTPSSASSADATLSPASSSSSDWYNSPSTPGQSEFCQTPRVQLDTIQEKDKDCIFPSLNVQNPIKKTEKGSLAERRGGTAPSLNLSEQVDSDRAQLMMDWCPSPPFIPDLDMEGLEIERKISLDLSDQSDEEREKKEDSDELSSFLHPVLYHWPEMNKIEEIHPGVLDSKSVFVMLALDSRTGTRKSSSKAKVLYIWLGSEAKLNNERYEGAEADGENDIRVNKIAMDFADQMGLQANTSIEIIKEGEEPEHFLNHLFSFH